MNAPVMTFMARGVLPPGDYELSLAELQTSLLVRGSGQRTTWDSAWRSTLVNRLGLLAQQLWSVGVSDIFVDGSFAEDKDYPNDIDGYFLCDLQALASGRLEQELNRLDPHKIWTWDPRSRRSFPGSPKRQLPMWHEYRVELYPHVGQGTGIRDVHGHEFEFPGLFRQSRETGEEKGIVKLKHGDTP